MRALVTGGAGFIGSTLVDRLLAEGYEVDVVDDLSTGTLANLAAARASGGALKFHQLDVRSADLVQLMTLRRPEVVFHLAAQISVALSVEQPLLDAEVNVLGSLRALEGARAAGSRKVVFAASGGTLYGDTAPEELPVNEGHVQAPRSPYGLAKKVVGEYLALYRELYGLEFTALALANVYGPRQDPHGEAGVVAIFAANILAGTPSTINGDGSQTRDFVFVDDVVDAFSRAGERGSGLVLNIGTGTQISVEDLHAVMAGSAGSSLAPRHGPARPGEVLASALDPSRAALHLGWKPWTPLADGIRAVLDSFAARDAPNGEGRGGSAVSGGGAGS